MTAQVLPFAIYVVLGVALLIFLVMLGIGKKDQGVKWAFIVLCLLFAMPIIFGFPDETWTLPWLRYQRIMLSVTAGICGAVTWRLSQDVRGALVGAAIGLALALLLQKSGFFAVGSVLVGTVLMLLFLVPSRKAAVVHEVEPS